MEIKPIGYAKTPFKEKFGIPRQSGRASVRGSIRLNCDYDESSIRGIEGFSHLWLIFDFSLSHRESFSQTVRPPRLGGNERVGVFASRSPYRPNSLGLSVVKLVNVECSSEGIELFVEGIDLVDGTPIFDIKPYLSADCIHDASHGYSDEHLSHRLEVKNTDVLDALDEKTRQEIIACIADDPRPAYQADERIYGMLFGCHNIKFRIENTCAYLLELE